MATDRTTLNRIVTAFLVAAVTALFVAMIRPFLLTIVLAGVFAAMLQPVYKRVYRLVGGRPSLASLVTLSFLLFACILPLMGLLGVLAGQAISMGRSAKEFLEGLGASGWSAADILGRLGLAGVYEAYRDTIVARMGEIAAKLGQIVMDTVSGVTVITIQSAFFFFVFLYTLFFFIKDGIKILDRFMSYVPLPEGVEQRLVERFTQVATSALKGVFVIGIVQGSLAGLAFRLVGIDKALFWGCVMAILSIIPAVGSAIVWVSASVILLLSGAYLKAAFLIAFCSIVVGGVDNLLRPWLVGRETKMHELMIFFGTLGGIGMFGITGFIIGPVVAALFITAWDIYSENFSDFLPDGPGAAPGEQKDEQAGTPR